MDRIKPRLTDVAIALQFAQHDIDNILRPGDSTDDQVYRLFSKWLQGVNQEQGDFRPVTWGSLISALQRAGLREEATILKKHCVSITSKCIISVHIWTQVV